MEITRGRSDLLTFPLWMNYQWASREAQRSMIQFSHEKRDLNSEMSMKADAIRCACLKNASSRKNLPAWNTDIFRRAWKVEKKAEAYYCWHKFWKGEEHPVKQCMCYSLSFGVTEAATTKILQRFLIKIATPKPMPSRSLFPQHPTSAALALIPRHRQSQADP